MANKELRKRLLVNRMIQGRLLGRFTCYWLVYHGVLWMTMFLYCYATHRGAVLAGAAPRTFDDLYGQFVNEHFSIWICAAAILPIVLWDLLQFSHRVAGPLVRFQNALKSLTAGETISEVRLRDVAGLVIREPVFGPPVKSGDKTAELKFNTAAEIPAVICLGRQNKAGVCASLRVGIIHLIKSRLSKAAGPVSQK